MQALFPDALPSINIFNDMHPFRDAPLGSNKVWRSHFDRRVHAMVDHHGDAHHLHMAALLQPRPNSAASSLLIGRIISAYLTAA